MRRFALVAMMAASIVLFGAGSAVAAQPAVHLTQDVTGDTLQCGDTTYTIVSGELAIVIHEGASASGNTNFTTTITPRNVVLQDQQGNRYSLRGAIWFGATSNASTGGFQATSTDKFQIVSQGGGTVDSVNAVEHVSPNGKEFFFDFGTCQG
jgi:hypothetical protein